MNGYKSSEQVLRQQGSTKAHEAQLLDARRQRKETDDQLQAMMNRIAFLAQEELRLDRDIEAARRRAAEALARQATKDQDIAATARDVLAVMPASNPPKVVRPHTGRSTLLASLSDGASAAASASAAPSHRASMTSQHSNKALESAPPASLASPTTSGMTAAPGTPNGPDGGGVSTSSGGSGGSPGTGTGIGTGQPPRAPSASRGRPAVLAGRASDKVNKLPPVAPTQGTSSIRSPSPGARPSSASRPSTASRSRASSISPNSTGSTRRLSTEGPAAAAGAANAATQPAPSASTASVAAGTLPPPGHLRSGNKGAGGGMSSCAAADEIVSAAGLQPSGTTHAPGIQQLTGAVASQHQPGSDLGADLSLVGLGSGCGTAAAGRNAMPVIHGAEPVADLPPALSSGGAGSGSSSARNTMTVIHGAAQIAGELDGEVIEELQQGSRNGGGVLGGPSGLQEFETESGRKVVVVKASRKTEGTTVSAAGVGWGMGGRTAATAAPIAPKEARQLQAEMAKKQQIWKVRKTFGLEPTPLSDRSAQVEELGAGAWQ
ncbi:hypothetical protein Vretimale_18976 [Volvox reticuliferus]|uniref:Uncharacterized protein n=1 Tax=Volvox reticuliferus TaxID=1737510 RepID=A0A8J4D2U0_9CHLO|nr:hypothetical protein Vretifemale_20073 [Volvox reticuliferus]GIM16346.1 hypothetical protein Vretimale_18976 [Volvox reticuliferus]